MFDEKELDTLATMISSIDGISNVKIKKSESGDQLKISYRDADYDSKLKIKIPSTEAFDDLSELYDFCESTIINNSVDK